MLVGGRDAPASLAGLELIADSYLSAATPVQQALPELFALGSEVRAAIAERVGRQPRPPGDGADARSRPPRCCLRRPGGRRSSGCRRCAATRRGPAAWSPTRASWCTRVTSSTFRAARSSSSACCPNPVSSRKAFDDWPCTSAHNGAVLAGLLTVPLMLLAAEPGRGGDAHAIAVVAQAGPDDGCPSPKQVTEALGARLPGMVQPLGQAFGRARCACRSVAEAGGAVAPGYHRSGRRVAPAARATRGARRARETAPRWPRPSR